MERKARLPEPPTLALRLKPYKSAIQQLRSVIRTLKENTTVTFLPTPALVLQTVRNQFVSKITFNSSCLYITDKSFQAKTINNSTPMLGNFMYLTSSKDLTKFYVQDISDLSAKIHMCAPDFNMEFSSPCVHGQDLMRESDNSAVHVDLDHSVVSELIKWISPHTRVKRNLKKAPCPTGTVQILVHSAPPAIKFILNSGSELEFTANTRVSFHGVKNMRVHVQLKNLYQTLMNCAVTKLPCTVRIVTEHDTVVHISSHNGLFAVDNFLTEEPFQRSDLSFDKNFKQQRAVAVTNSGAMHDDGCGSGLDSEMMSEPVSRKHERMPPRKSNEHDHNSKEKYEQHKITSYLTTKGAANSGERNSNYFNDAKEESDSEDSVSFEFVPSSKKQKCT
ncbi:DNA polymerase processivity subunit [macacine betaherpesvirus 3]|uniref:DNA polymerase processivity factor n=1 Tax=Rhesus cytomegalovirus (strain 68-1) TaxID=47929 RepID=Q2FAP9_RHCM6|nr:rh70 [macacine betaherpesvirus 3]AAP50597.1 rh70 [macacine betaherpesvirus 3]QMS44066.1 Rh70 [synthetic construct]QQL10556.1 Rh70 [Rhesus cytomegalovirus strain 68-1.2]QQL10738.1 Rh70 [Rhesus cytomegalovirus strain 68-1_FL]AAZ80570.1 rhUL44 [macacine betaherpesvirus 3]